MKDKQAFTFIEILISVTIVALVSAVSISSFSSFFSKQQSNTVSKRVDLIIKNLDAQVMGSKISWYSLEFASWATFLKAEINNLNNKYKIYLDPFSYSTLTWTVYTNNISTDTWNFYILYDGIIKETFERNWSWDIVNLDISRYGSWKDVELYSNISWSATNKFIFYNLWALKDWDEGLVGVNIKSFSWYIDNNSRLYIENKQWDRKIFVKQIWWALNYLSWSTVLLGQRWDEIPLILK